MYYVFLCRLRSLELAKRVSLSFILFMIILHWYLLETIISFHYYASWLKLLCFHFVILLITMCVSCMWLDGKSDMVQGRPRVGGLATAGP